MNMIVAYDINRYNLLSDNKYYRYRTLIPIYTWNKRHVYTLQIQIHV